MTNDVLAQNIANYNSGWSARAYSAEPALRPVEARLIEAFFPRPPARVLDIGCGAGRTTGALAELGYQVVGIDLAESLLANARRRYPSLDFRQMDATALAFESASFDAAIFSYNGLDNIFPEASRVRSLFETYRVLRNDGPYICSSHNLIGAIGCGGPFYVPGHLRMLGFLASQWRNALAFNWYLRYDDGGGEQFLFSAPPARTVQQLERAGFAIAAVCGDDGILDLTLRRVTRRYQHVHFVGLKRG
jgi:SAM-dependent methyltransferase